MFIEGLRNVLLTPREKWSDGEKRDDNEFQYKKNRASDTLDAWTDPGWQMRTFKGKLANNVLKSLKSLGPAALAVVVLRRLYKHYMSDHDEASLTGICVVALVQSMKDKYAKMQLTGKTKRYYDAKNAIFMQIRNDMHKLSNRSWLKEIYANFTSINYDTYASEMQEQAASLLELKPDLLLKIVNASADMLQEQGIPATVKEQNGRLFMVLTMGSQGSKGPDKHWKDKSAKEKTKEIVNATHKVWGTVPNVE